LTNESLISVGLFIYTYT